MLQNKKVTTIRKLLGENYTVDKAANGHLFLFPFWVRRSLSYTRPGLLIEVFCRFGFRGKKDLRYNYLTEGNPYRV